MPAEKPASVFSGEGPERFSLVARFGVWGLVSRTFDVPDDTVDGASIGAKTTMHAKVQQRGSLPLSAREEVLWLGAASTFDCLPVRTPLPVSRAQAYRRPGFLREDGPLGPDVELSLFVVIAPFCVPSCLVYFSNLERS
jgi:hypothetical protein